MAGTIHESPYCDRCGKDITELGRVIIHRDTDLQEKETSYYDLCPRCMKHLDTFLTYQESANG